MPVDTTESRTTAPTTPAPPRRATRRKRPAGGQLARALVAWAIALLTVFPLVWLLLTAFKPEGESFSGGWPSHWTWDNLKFVLTEVPFPRYLLNSAIVSVVVTVLALLFHSMAAYALSRLRFRGSGLVLGAMVSTMLVSLPVILVPLFLIAKALGLLDNFAGLIVPMIFNAFGIFLLRQYYLNFPTELEDAAQLDGCGYPRLFWHVVLPLSRPALASLSVLFFLANWNAFLWPLVITSNPDLAVVQVGMSSLQGQYASAYNYVLAGSLIAVIPTILVFLLGQRWLIESMKSSGLK
ncbi:carbohydrate ABC transporter permease [Flexivirga meconopsidis]|uniref:carbohydrate ABC transporter permease n=1 Tax=Flexivirga meconopsidis TaxID=2977121 RepID=UPI002240AB72|nr:carbohydrate ABC transporter permease [Flexivirga meconopsidis]